jgi:hypothetical protein
MSFVGGTGTVPALSVWQRLQKTGDEAMERFERRPNVQREMEYFRETARKLAQLGRPREGQPALSAAQEKARVRRVVEEMTGDPRMMRFILSSFGMDGEEKNMGRLKKIFAEDPTNDRSLASRLIDPRFKRLAEAFDFFNRGTTRLTSTSFLDQVADRFVVNEYEKSLGEQNPALRQASYFVRNIGNVQNVFQILGDNVLRSVVTTALQLPKEMINLSIERQAAMIEARLDIEDLRLGPQGVAAQRVQDARADSAAIAKNQRIVKAATDSLSEIITRIDRITANAATLGTQTDPVGQNAALIATQTAAIPQFARLELLLAGADSAAGRLVTTIGTLNDLMAEAQAAAVANNPTLLADVQSRFSQAIASATADVASSDVINATSGLSESLLTGGGATSFSFVYNGAGATMNVTGQSLPSFLASLASADNEFQNLTVANMSGLTAIADDINDARGELTTARIGLNENRERYAAAKEAVPSWVAQINVGALQNGQGAITDALARSQTIATRLTTLRSLAAQAETIGAGDRTAVQAQFASLVSEITGLANTAGAGVGDNLLNGANASYEIIGGQNITVRGHDFAAGLLNGLSAENVDSDAAATTLKNNIDALYRGFVTNVRRALRVEEQAINNTLSTFNPRGSLDAEIRKLANDMTGLRQRATIEGNNLFDAFQTPLTVRLGVSGRTITIRPETGYAVNVDAPVRAAPGFLPNNLAGALAELTRARNEASNARSRLNVGARALQNEADALKPTLDAAKEAEEKAKKDPFAASAATNKLIRQFLVLADASAAQNPGANNPALQLLQPGNASNLLNFIV